MLERKAFSPEEIAKRNGVSRAKVYLEMQQGKLEARKLGRRTMITLAAEDAWLEAMPRFAMA